MEALVRKEQGQSHHHSERRSCRSSAHQRGLLTRTNQIKASRRTKYDHVGEQSRHLPGVSSPEAALGALDSLFHLQVNLWIPELRFWWCQPPPGQLSPVITCTWPSLTNVPGFGSGVTQRGWDFVAPPGRVLIFSGQMFLLHSLANPGIWSQTCQAFQTKFKFHWSFRNKVAVYWISFL